MLERHELSMEVLERVVLQRIAPITRKKKRRNKLTTKKHNTNLVLCRHETKSMYVTLVGLAHRQLVRVYKMMHIKSHVGSVQRCKILKLLM